MMIKEIHKQDGFKLLSLWVKNHPILGDNLFKFIDDNDRPDSIYFSVLIGSNGTGKSEILRSLLILFRNIYQLDKKPTGGGIDCWFEFKYSLFGNIYTFSNLPNEFLKEYDSRDKLPVYDKKAKLYLLENNDFSKFQNLTKAKDTLPSAIIANSIMLTDKYFVPRNKEDEMDFPIYRYLGIRQRPQQASTRYYVRKTIEFIAEHGASESFFNGIRKVSSFFADQRSVQIIYFTAFTSKFFDGELTPKVLEDYFYPIRKKYSNLPEKIAPFKLNIFDNLRIDANKIQELCDFVNNLVKNGRLNERKQKGSSVKVIRYDICDENSHSILKNEYKNLDLLRKIGLLTAPEVRLIDQNEIDLKDSSSGEFHFFSTMIGLMASIKPNSLILIDEPEISLHPNWQMKYLHFLRELFSNPEYKTCQIIIATHSHFLISDLVGNSSKIIGLKKENNKVQTIDLQNLNTFGWSAEEVLYKVFDVRTTRNHYLEMDIRKMLSLIAEKSENHDKIRDILSRLSKVQLNEHDPLGLVINQAKEFIK